eukprot:4899374-Amphidinium_carterae.1
MLKFPPKSAPKWTIQKWETSVFEENSFTLGAFFLFPIIEQAFILGQSYAAFCLVRFELFEWSEAKHRVLERTRMKSTRLESMTSHYCYIILINDVSCQAFVFASFSQCGT